MITLVSSSLDLDEVRDHVISTNRLNSVAKPWLEMADCRSVNNVKALSGEGLRSIASMDREVEWCEGSKAAIVVNSPLNYGLATIFAVVGSHANKRMQVFYDLDRAMAWLNLPCSDDEVIQTLELLQTKA